MKNFRIAWLAVVIVGAALLVGTVAAQGNGPQANLGTAFSFQSRLTDGGQPANGLYDLQFVLFDADSGGSQVGPTVSKDDVEVDAGLFSVELDFGNVFDGKALFMEIRVRPGNSTGNYTTLSPRVSLTAAPYALYALNNWGLNGNSGLSANNYLGTSDNMTLTLGVSNTAALRIIPALDPGHGFAPNVLGGSSANTISGTIVGATIAGGGVKYFPNVVGGSYAFVGGGAWNTASGSAATVAGGNHNTASGGAATVGGGEGNTTGGLGDATVSGGAGNTAQSSYASVGGGVGNTASSDEATVSGGGFNIASGQSAVVGGGEANSASGRFAGVGSGQLNVASGAHATVPGGFSNTALGDYSFAAGRRAKANHAGAFVWGDSTDADVISTAPNEFIARASGGFTLFPNTGSCTLTSGGVGWSCSSDRALKENFTTVNGKGVLAALAQIPITQWNVKGATAQHVGPMAQDFYAAFHLGEDNIHINTVDAQGVALASIQGLYQITQDEIAARDAQIAQLQARLDALEQRAGPLVTGSAAPKAWILLAVGILIGSGAFWFGSRRAKGGIR